MGHYQSNCKSKKSESEGQKNTSAKSSATAKSVHTTSPKARQTEGNTLTSLLFSSSDESSESDTEVCTVRVSDHGSQLRVAKVEIHGVVVHRLIDTGADITIMNGDTFRKIASVARLKKKQFKAADKTPYGYDRRSFKLDGRMDLDIMFNDKEIRTPVYIKADAKDSLLLSEGVCHQLGILTYHPDVQLLKKPRKKPQTKEAAQVSSVQVSLVQSVKLVPFHNTVADVKVSTQEIGLFLFEPDSLMLSPDVRVREGLLSTGDDGTAHIVLENASGFTQMVEKNTKIGRGYTATVVDLECPAAIGYHYQQ